MTEYLQAIGSPPDPSSDTPPSLSLCTRLVNCAKDAIVLQDLHSRILWINRAAEQMFGWPLEEVRGLPGISVTAGADQATEFHYDLQSPIFDRYVVARHKRRDGSQFWNQQTFAKVEPIHENQQKMILVSCRDITEQVQTETALRQTQEKLRCAAYHDDLTELANRKKLQTYLETPLVSRALANQQIGVLQLDLDKFKEINDSFGHAAGDSTLIHVAEALRLCSEPQDLACRSGGDEFLLVCPKVASTKALMTRAETLLKEIGSPLHWQDQTLHIRASIGASLASAATTCGEDLIHQADQALYAAKEGGRAQTVIYTPELGKIQTTKTRLAREIQTAMTAGQFSIDLQPHMRLEDNRIVGCEALLRWNHPDYGQLLPENFLDIARRSGVLADLDYRSMNLSLDALAKLREAGHDRLTVSLNASAEIMADSNYTGLLDWALQSRGLSPADVCIEIQETAILQPDNYEIATTVDKLKRLGTKVALDDFGTGYAGLAHMSFIDLDAIKLDCALIAKLERDTRTQHIVTSLIRLSRQLGMSVIAEGVETQEQLDLLRAADCPNVQGFGLAHPMPVADFLIWLDTLTSGICPFGHSVSKAS
ncbi:MAG: EAL domain-containing protein [Pseudomonadota bacterium]